MAFSVQSDHPAVDGQYEKVPLPKGLRSALGRNIALGVLRLLVLSALLAVPFAFWMWCKTAKACWEIYVRQERLPTLLDPGASWEGKLTGLDISSCSALIALLLLLLLMIRGCRNSWWLPRRERKEFQTHAYDSTLFPDGFGLLCVRLGLIGTLISFLLAAVVQIGQLEALSPARDVVLDQVVSQRIDKAAGEPDEADLDGVGGVIRSSQQIFLLLCASLVSTLVGSLAAYVVLPPLEWLNAEALGRNSLPSTNVLGSTTRVCRAMDDTADRLGEFSRLLTAAEQYAQQVASGSKAATRLESQLKQTAGSMANAATGLATAAEELNHVRNRLDMTNDRLDANSRQLAKLPSELRNPIDRLDQVAREAVGKLGQHLDTTDRQLSSLGGAIREPLRVVARVIQNALCVVQRLGDSVGVLLEGQAQDREATEEVATSFIRLEATVVALVQNVGRLAHGVAEERPVLFERLDEIHAVNEMAASLEEQMRGLDRDVASLRTTMHEQRTDMQLFAGRVGALERRLARPALTYSKHTGTIASPDGAPRLLNWLRRLLTRSRSSERSGDGDGIEAGDPCDRQETVP